MQRKVSRRDFSRIERFAAQGCAPRCTRALMFVSSGWAAGADADDHVGGVFGVFDEEFDFWVSAAPDADDGEGLGLGDEWDEFEARAGEAGETVGRNGDAAADFDGGDQAGDAVVFFGQARDFFIWPGEPGEPVQKFGIIFLRVTEDSFAGNLVERHLFQARERMDWVYGN